MAFQKRKKVDLNLPHDIQYKKEKKRMTYEEKEKIRELERKRKIGEAPLEIDEDGREVNPHIPKFISEAPWYLSTGKTSLRHQKKRDEASKNKDFGMKTWYARGKKAGPAATKYRKGACTNCGAMTHKAKDCMERPRKKGAKFTGEDIQADEIIQPTVNLGFEGNRDRWNGYDPEMYKAVMAKYEERDEARRKMELEERQKKLAAGELENSEGDSSSEEFNPDTYAKSDPKTRTTVRSLRDREVTAKYLYNLDLNSAYYDPKSRSLRQNPFEGTGVENPEFVGDNWQKEAGDTEEYKKLHRAAWDLAEKGAAPNMFSSPSEAAMMVKKMEKAAEQKKSATKAKLLEEYGGQEFAKAPSNDFLRGQSEVYVEYTPDGRVIQKDSGKKVIPTSKYKEDVYINNHSSVWGSWYEGGNWGFACCHQTTKSSFCLGYVPEDKALTLPAQPEKVEPTKKKRRRKRDRDDSDSDSDSDSSSESSSSSSSGRRRRKRKKKDKKKRRKKSRKRRRERDSDHKDRSSKRARTDDRVPAHLRAPTDEEMDTYRASKVHWDDPMRKMKPT